MGFGEGDDDFLVMQDAFKGQRPAVAACPLRLWRIA